VGCEDQEDILAGDDNLRQGPSRMHGIHWLTAGEPGSARNQWLMLIGRDPGIDGLSFRQLGLVCHQTRMFGGACGCRGCFVGVRNIKERVEVLDHVPGHCAGKMMQPT
jgi:hypothetical protein